jgi:hypothetical protein
MRVKTWRCGHPKTKANTMKGYPTRPNGRCRQCRLASNARYRETPKAKARNARYRATPKAKATTARYDASPEGKARYARYAMSTKGWLTAARRHARNLCDRIERLDAEIAALRASSK